MFQQEIYIYSKNICRQNSHISILTESSVKTKLIYCQLMWRHVSTHRVIIRSIIEQCLTYIKKQCTLFWIPKCLQGKKRG